MASFTGTTTFNSNLPTSTLTPTTGTQLTTKSYVDSSVTAGGSTILSSKNTWTGASNAFETLYANYFNVPNIDCTGTLSSQNYACFTGTATFNSNLPTSTLTPTTSTQLTTKSYVDAAITTGGNLLLSSNNTWSYPNTFNETVTFNRSLISNSVCNLYAVNIYNTLTLNGQNIVIYYEPKFHVLTR